MTLWRPSPNFSSRHGAAVDTIVIHITDGQPNVDRTVKRFQDSESHVAPHFVVGRGGEVVQLVRLADSAWHAAGINNSSIGIEHVARTPGEFKNWSSLPLSKRLKLCLPGQEGSSSDPGLPLTEELLVASSALVAQLFTLYPDARLIGHCEVPGTTHLDCGADVTRGGIWPWEVYKQMTMEAQNAKETTLVFA